MARREKGEGSLYQTKEKTWVCQYSVDGERKTKRFQRKSGAKAFIASLEQEGLRTAHRGPLNDHKRACVEKLGDIYNSGYNIAPADQEMEEPQEQGYGFDFGMSF